MDSAIDRDLKRAERRELHLWILAFTLLTLFGTIVIGQYSLKLLGDADSHPVLTRATTYRALGGSFFLTALFCLYVLRVLRFNRRMKSLLVEMNGVAACGLGLGDLLPSIAEKIADTSFAATCRIALLAHECTALRIRAAHSDRDEEPQLQVGRVYPLEELRVWKRVAESVQPIVVRSRDLPELSADDKELLGGGLQAAHSYLIVPMVTENRMMGIIILGRASRLWSKRFTSFRIAAARTMANHAASAIDQAKLRKETTRDPLTHLYIRRHFSERIKKEISRADRDEHVMGVLLCELGPFEAVDDVQEQKTGDAVLTATAEGIRDATRGTDLAFRWGRNEVVVVLPKSSREGGLIVASRIRQAVLNSASRAGLDFDISIGIALYPEHGRNEDSLIRLANRALSIAKDRGMKIQLGEEEYELDEHSIGVEFQAVVDVSSERIVGYEALARDAQVKLSALELFEEYRATGRLSQLKQMVLTSQIKKAEEVGLERVFINADFDLLSQLDPVYVPPTMNVVVELSEREALHEPERHLSVTRKWREKGYQFAVDDFGAGLISLPFLSMLAPEYVKVDRSTMLRATSSRQFREFLGSLIQAVRTYAVKGIIAEGVETRDELEVVKAMGISFVQGSLLGKRDELKSATETPLGDRVLDTEYV
jgi:diguanylate cyclase (GGDEF)-like protein